MHVLIEIEPGQLDQIRRITGKEPIPTALSENGSIANFSHGPPSSTNSPK